MEEARAAPAGRNSERRTRDSISGGTPKPIHPVTTRRETILFFGNSKSARAGVVSASWSRTTTPPLSAIPCRCPRAGNEGPSSIAPDPPRFAMRVKRGGTARTSPPSRRGACAGALGACSRAAPGARPVCPARTASARPHRTTGPAARWPRPSAVPARGHTERGAPTVRPAAPPPSLDRRRRRRKGRADGLVRPCGAIAKGAAPARAFRMRARAGPVRHWPGALARIPSAKAWRRISVRTRSNPSLVPMMRGANGFSRCRASRGMWSLTRTAKVWISGEAHRGASECASPARKATSDMTHILPSPGLPMLPLTSSTRSKARCNFTSRSIGVLPRPCRPPAHTPCRLRRSGQFRPVATLRAALPQP